MSLKGPALKMLGSGGSWIGSGGGTGGGAGSFKVTFDGQGSVLATGNATLLYFNSALTITGIVLLAPNESGSIQLAINKITYTSFPGSGSSIVASAPPVISSAQKSKNTTLTGWTTSLAADDILIVSIASVTTLTKVQMFLLVNGA